MADFNATLELTNAGLGLAAFLSAITSPLAGFLMALGIITAIILVIRKVAGRIGRHV